MGSDWIGEGWGFAILGVRGMGGGGGFALSTAGEEEEDANEWTGTVPSAPLRWGWVRGTDRSAVVCRRCAFASLDGP
jgi:hypothetical protein